MSQFQNSLTLRIDKVKAEKNIKKALKRIGLANKISLEEIENELSKVETPFQSFLLLGILKRIMALKDRKAGELYIPSILTLINFIPREDLGGITPKEHLEKYPLGPLEWNFINKLIEEYNQRLIENENQLVNPSEIKKDFEKFQNEFLERIPLEQPFSGKKERLMTIKEIIIEERRKAKWPEELIDKIGLRVFPENVPEFLGLKMTQIEDSYFQTIKELKEMQMNPKKRDRKRIHQLRELLRTLEPYFRTSDIAHQFYLNYAMVSFLDDEKLEKVLHFLDKALSYKSDYEVALEMKKRLMENFEIKRSDN